MTNTTEKNTILRNEYSIASFKKDVRSLLRRTNGIKTVGNVFFSSMMRLRIIYFSMAVLLLFLPVLFCENLMPYAKIYKYLVGCFCLILGYAYFAAGYVEDQILNFSPFKKTEQNFKTHLLASYWKMAFKQSFIVLGTLLILTAITEFVPIIKDFVLKKMFIIEPILLLDIPLWIFLALAICINNDIKKNICPSCGLPYTIKLSNTDICDKEVRLVNVVQTQNIFDNQNQLIGQAQIPVVEARESFWLKHNYVCNVCGYSYQKSKFVSDSPNIEQANL